MFTATRTSIINCKGLIQTTKKAVKVVVFPGTIIFKFLSGKGELFSESDTKTGKVIIHIIVICQFLKCMNTHSVSHIYTCAHMAIYKINSWYSH